jgi:hypothetical protein
VKHETVKQEGDDAQNNEQKSQPKWFRMTLFSMMAVFLLLIGAMIYLGKTLPGVRGPGGPYTNEM